MKTSEILQQAFETIADPTRVAKGAFAKDARGMRVEILDPTAVCFCSMGAIHKAIEVAGLKYEEEAGVIQNEAIDALCLQSKIHSGIGSIARVNDELSHDKLCEIWKLAIAETKKQEEAQNV